MYFDNAATVWGELRSTRHKPPGAAASDGQRRLTYTSALEQAEQLFQAATVVGPATRPLPLFYGLSQAGRAIAASSTKLADDAWQLRGHGIKCDGLDGDLGSLRICVGKPGSSGSFVRLSEILDSPLWSDGAATLAPLWDVLPLNLARPLGVDDNDRRTALLLAEPELFQTEHPLLTATVYRLPAWVVTSPTPRVALDEYLKAFPGATGYSSYSNTGTGGGAYLLLTPCPGCSLPDAVREVPTLSVACLADLGDRPRAPSATGAELNLEQTPVEFFDDPAHRPNCPLR